MSNKILRKLIKLQIKGEKLKQRKNYLVWYWTKGIKVCGNIWDLHNLIRYHLSAKNLK